MTREEFQAKYPLVLNWIRQTIAAHKPRARTTASFNFPRLPQYFTAELLQSAKVVPVETVPLPPLSAIGLGQFADFENIASRAITYLDTYFIQEEMVDDEQLHCHELIHVLQWRILGPERFLALYADGLERFGYRHSPLETMAYDGDEAFQESFGPFNAETYVRRKLRLIIAH